jgi:hypothetical protein
MMHVEAQEFIDREMRTRWPDWDPTAAQVSDWIEWLRPHPIAIALSAVRQHAAESRWKIPAPDKILAACKASLRPTARREDRGIVPTYLVLDDPGCPPVGKRGWMISIVAVDAAGRQSQDSYERIACATAYAQRFFGSRGARFEIFLDQDQALRRRTELMDAPAAPSMAAPSLAGSLW